MTITKTWGSGLAAAGVAVGSARGTRLARATSVGGALAAGDDVPGEVAGTRAIGALVHAASRHATTRTEIPRALPLTFEAYR